MRKKFLRLHYFSLQSYTYSNLVFSPLLSKLRYCIAAVVWSKKSAADVLTQSGIAIFTSSSLEETAENFFK